MLTVRPWQWLACIAFLTLPSQLAAKLPAVSLVRYSQEWGSWKDAACFVGLQGWGIHANASNEVYNNGHVIVLDLPGAHRKRLLAFKASNGWCNPQAGAYCHQDSFAPSTAFVQSATAGTSADMRCVDTCAFDLQGTLGDEGSGYVRSMAAAMMLLPSSSNPAGRSFLSVGFGSGLLALTLKDKFPGASHTAVELSPEVVAAAECFGARAPGLDIVTADGREYIDNAADGAYDALIIDAFGAEDTLPGCFTTADFFNTARRKLRAGGLLVMDMHSGRSLHDDLIDILPGVRGAFPDVRVGAAPGVANRILVARDPSQTVGASFLSRGGYRTTDEQLASWFAAAGFADAGPAKGEAKTDTDVQCRA